MPDASTTQIREWVERCRAGDPAARDELLTHTRGRLVAIVRKCRRERFAAHHDDLATDDVLQDLCVRLLERWDGFNPPPADDPAVDPARAFFAFAARAIRDVLCDAVRRRVGRGKQPRPRAASLNEMAGAGDEGGAFEPGQDTYDPEQIAQWAEVHAFINQLPRPLREVADLHWYHDLTHAEVGNTLGIAEITARTRWAQVRHHISQKFPDSPFRW